jgi:hypothetical protein
MSKIDSDLVLAYRMTDYRVSGSGPDFVLRVDEFSRPLEALLEARGLASAAFLTGWNSWSRPTSNVHNEAANKALRSKAEALGCVCVDAAGVDPTGKWPPERSLLILGVELKAAQALAVDFEQNAFIWSGEDAVPRLILMR